MLRRFARRTGREAHRNAVTSGPIRRTDTQLSPGKCEALKWASSLQQSSLMRQDRSALIGSFTSSCKRALWALCKLRAVPMPIRVIVVGITALAVFSIVNLVYQMLQKPTEVFAFIPNESNKAPIETWRQFAPLFQEYSTV